MKKISLIVIVSAIGFCSCTKEEMPVPVAAPAHNERVSAPEYLLRRDGDRPPVINPNPPVPLPTSSF